MSKQGEAHNAKMVFIKRQSEIMEEQHQMQSATELLKQNNEIIKKEILVLRQNNELRKKEIMEAEYQMQQEVHALKVKEFCHKKCQ